MFQKRLNLKFGEMKKDVLGIFCSLLVIQVVSSASFKTLIGEFPFDDVTENELFDVDVSISQRFNTTIMLQNKQEQKESVDRTSSLFFSILYNESYGFNNLEHSCSYIINEPFIIFPHTTIIGVAVA